MKRWQKSCCTRAYSCWWSVVGCCITGKAPPCTAQKFTVLHSVIQCNTLSNTLYFTYRYTVLHDVMHCITSVLKTAFTCIALWNNWGQWIALYYTAAITLHNIYGVFSSVLSYGQCNAVLWFRISESIGSTHHGSLICFFFCPLCKIQLEREIRVKATFVGTRLIVQTNVATHTFAATKRHFEFDPPSGILWRDMHVWHLVQTFWQWCGEALGARRNTVKSTVGKETRWS